MKIDIGSFGYNFRNRVGGNPSWGTSVGQTSSHKITKNGKEDLLLGMTFCSIDISQIDAEFGRGGQRTDDNEIISAAMFNNIYVNGTEIPDACFIMLLIRQTGDEYADVHHNRITLKYPQTIQFAGVTYNEDLFQKINETMGWQNDWTWFASDISIVSQNQLHFRIHCFGENVVFNNAAEKNRETKRLMQNDGVAVADDNPVQCIMNKIQPKASNQEYANELINIRERCGNVFDAIRLFGAIYHDYVNSDSFNEIRTLAHFTTATERSYRQEFEKGVALGQYLYPKDLLISDNGQIVQSDDADDEVKVGINHVVYGTPGCGKSFYVENTLLKDYKRDENNNLVHAVRTTFYQDYTNTDFIGQILPNIVENDKGKRTVEYKFKPGPFVVALLDAYLHPNNNCALIIEELNRGNAPSIFGEIFQLLDRKEDGRSRYSIVNPTISKYLKEKGVSEFKNDDELHPVPIFLPSNLSLYATMNTSDQNVYTLDLAFKRRWDFQKLENIFKEDHPYADFCIPGMSKNITWKKLVTDINKFIVRDKEILNNEDKQIGVFFIEESYLFKDYKVATDEEKKKFAFKFFEYLWDDVAKFSRPEWFKEINTLDELVDSYLKKGEAVFNDGIITKDNNSQSPSA
jgi:hypothetical protein